MLAAYSQERFLVHHMLINGMLLVAHDKNLNARCLLQYSSVWILDLVSRLHTPGIFPSDLVWQIASVL